MYSYHILYTQANNEHGILSTYVQGVEDLNKNINGHYEVSHLCEILWNTQIRNQQAKALRRMTAPKLTTTWGAGYSFSKCHAMRAVPYDPYLPQVFDGEEFSMYARYFTHGYDVYTPSRSYIGHDYNGANNPNAGSWHVTSVHDKAAEHIASNKRLWTLLDMPGGDTGQHAKVIFLILFILLIVLHVHIYIHQV
jgi:Glycosyltransferase (GlcNAc)